MACLTESDFQGYLEEPGAIHVEEHMVSCGACRAAFDSAASTHQRVNAWFAELDSSGDEIAVDVPAAFAGVMGRVGIGSADAHLTRLLAPDTDVPWYTSIVGNLRDIVHPEKLPPLELTSQPVVVKDLWGRGTSRRAIASALLFQGALAAALMLVGTNEQVRKAIANVALIAPPPPPKPAAPKPNQGGGGSRSALPAQRAELPKPAPRVFTPPVATVEHPALIMDASLIAPPDAWAAPTGAIGNPLGNLTGDRGPGGGGGLGPGTGPGIGGGRGGGTGGDGGPIYAAGSGVTEPSLVSKVDPEYSEEARRAKYNGTVSLSIVVNADGRAENIVVTRSVGMGLDEKAIEAVRKWRFKPGMKQGVAVKTRALVDVNFRLL